jgi:hypothetical protein
MEAGTTAQSNASVPAFCGKPDVTYTWAFLGKPAHRGEDACPVGDFHEHLLRPRPHDGALGHSVYTVPLFASAAECGTLMKEATARILARPKDESRRTRMKKPRCRLQLACVPPARMEVVFLHRLLAFLEARMPDLAQAVFGQSTGLADMEVAFSTQEPAVNVYHAGGQFLAHCDKEALTILVPLSPANEFEGGGTAFWAHGTHLSPEQINGGQDPNDGRRWLPHEHVANEAQGTAVLFGGDVCHAGLPVRSGRRDLFVMSFNLRPRPLPPVCPPRAPAAAAAAAPPQEERTMYAFPTLDQLSRVSEEDYRAMGIGYRAKFMSESVAKVIDRGGLPWLQSLRTVPHAEARAALLELTGVGMKVADCVCLFSLDKADVVPVDTHVWKIAVEYMPHLADSKSLTPRIYDSVLAHFKDKFGSHAGWAHQILFAAELNTFKDRCASLSLSVCLSQLLFLPVSTTLFALNYSVCPPN